MTKQQVLSYIRLTAGREAEELLPVDGGLTDADKYRARLGADYWMVKLLEGDANREIWYRELNAHTGRRLATPEMRRLFDDGRLCLISPWIEGESLSATLSRSSTEEAVSYGRQAAELVLELHRDAVEYPAHADWLRNRILTACRQVEELGLCFEGYKECLSFLRSRADSHAIGRLSLVHNDIRPENILLSEGDMYLIDFDNGGLGERASDFSYLTTMVMPAHMVFSRALTERYLEVAEDSTFWQCNLLYSTLKVVEYAIWKWQNKKKQVYFQAENLMRQYDGLTSTLPHWWREL